MDDVCPKCGKVCSLWGLVVKHVASGKRGRKAKLVKETFIGSQVVPDVVPGVVD